MEINSFSNCKVVDTPAYVSLNNQVPSRLEPSDEITISCYENEVPAFVAAEMDQLYQHINSSLSHFRIARQAKDASTYVVRRGSDAIAILLFVRKKRKVSVINEMIQIEEKEIQRFVNYIFSRYPRVSMISFSLIQKNIRKFPFPSQQFDSSEDIVLTLPATPQAYLDSLSSNMRRNIRHSIKTLTRDFPSYRFHVYEKEEISEPYIRDIINLNKSRIINKNMKFGHDADETEWILRLVKACGLVGVATIDGRICGGAINFRIGANYFGHVIAHDAQYNEYGLGILCCYLTICENIIRGGKNVHFSWGRYEYKYRLLGVQRDMARLDLYRSYLPYFLNAGVLVKNAVKTYIQRAKISVLDMERQSKFTQSSVTLRLAIRCIKFLRMVKRFRLIKPHEFLAVAHTRKPSRFGKIKSRLVTALNAASLKKWKQPG